MQNFDQGDVKQLPGEPTALVQYGEFVFVGVQIGKDFGH